MTEDRTPLAWPGAPGGPPTPEDRKVLEAQLRFVRYEPVRVVCRCPAGQPQVVLSFFAPGEPTEVSTNIFWVTSPYLRVGVDRLEARGLARELKAWVLGDEARAEAFRQDQLAYHGLVVRLFDAWLSRPPPRAGEFGIGGVRALDQLKCLHAHLACHLATGRSVVGARVEEILKQELRPGFLCEEGRCPRT